MRSWPWRVENLDFILKLNESGSYYKPKTMLKMALKVGKDLRGNVLGDNVCVQVSRILRISKNCSFFVTVS